MVQTRKQMLKNLAKGRKKLQLSRKQKIATHRTLKGRSRTKQTGKSNTARDLKRKAKAPGYRVSKNGNRYYEGRKNRSDIKPGRL